MLFLNMVTPTKMWEQKNVCSHKKVLPHLRAGPVISPFRSYPPSLYPPPPLLPSLLADSLLEGLLNASW